MLGSSGSNLSIGISLIMRDQFTGRARRASRELDNLDKKAQRMHQRNMEMERNSNAIGAGVGLMAIRGMRQAVKIGAEFTDKMTYVSEIAENKGGVGYEQLSKKAKTLGMETMFTARQMASGMRYMAMAGQDTQKIWNNVEAAVALAGSTMSRLEGKGGSADILTNLMKGFQWSDTEENSMRMADVLTKATTSANTDLWDLHEAMKYTMSTARDLNITFEETAAMAMMAGDAGLQGSIAGTAIENMLRYLTKALGAGATGRQTDALTKMGLTPDDLQTAGGELMNISDLLKLVSKRISGMGTVDAQNALIDLFGVRGKREASLIKDDTETFSKYIDLLNNGSNGAALKILHKRMSTLKGTSDQLYSAWESLKISFTEALEPVLIPLIQGFTAVLKLMVGLSETPLGKWLSILGAGFVVVKTAIMGYRAIVLSLKLYHMQMGQSFSGAASRIISGYGGMTAAANGYAAAANRAAYSGGAVTFNKGAGRYARSSGSSKGGRFTSTAAAQRYSNLKSQGRGVLGSGKYGGSLGKLGKKIGGKGSLIGLGGSMLLGMGSQAVGQETGWGKAMSIGGDALGFASTGAMIGSVVPGIGTAVGGIVGGVGGLLWGLYDKLGKVEDDVKQEEEKVKSQNVFDQTWADKARTLWGMKQGEKMHAKGYNNDVNKMNPTTEEGTKQWLANGGGNVNNIRITVDGIEVFDKQVEQNDYEAIVNLAAF